jgi:hypothetical protein
MRKKNLWNKSIRWNIVSYILMGVLLFSIVVLSLQFFDYQKTTYCKVENNLDIIGIDGSECVLYAISSKDHKDLEMIGTCSDKLSDLGTCQGQKMFFTVHSLDSLCDDCDTQGSICLGTYVTYGNVSNETIQQYENKFGYEVAEEPLLFGLVETCEGSATE